MLNDLNVTLKELELNFNRLGENNIALRKEKGELGAQLAARTAEKAALEKDFEKLKTEANNTIFQLRNRLVSCCLIPICTFKKMH